MRMRFKGEYIPSSSFVSKEEGTFDHDEKLPSLPVPELSQTIRKYLDSVQPHLSAEEFQKTESTAVTFLQGEGQHLHKLLLERAKQRRNWLDDWWLSHAYLRLRFPIAPFMNFGGPAPYIYHFWPPMAGTQIQRAALILYLNLQHWDLLRRERLTADKGGRGAEPWTMHQFRRMYNCCRTPGLEEDAIEEHFRTYRDGLAPSHIIVFCNKRMYCLNTLDSDGQIFQPPQLEQALSQIKCNALQKGTGIGVASLTSEERTVWHHVRNELMSIGETNREVLRIIQTAVFSLSLLPQSPDNITDISREALLGPPGNIWYDKSYSLLAFENGVFGNNCDHAPMDAMTMVNATYFMDAKLIECHGCWQGDNTRTSVPAVKELEFTLSKRILSAIASAEEKFTTAAQSMEIINPVFGHFGKTFLRENKLHPDTFVQVCLQYAYFKLHGKMAPTYETATTRRFYRGRTETVRSCTMEAAAFAKAMVDSTATEAYRVQLLKQAMARHHSLMHECMNAQGVDRHLMGLRLIAEESHLPVPQLYKDVAFERSGGNGNYVLSTSFVGFTSVHGGVAPMCKSGYGVFYRIGAERIVFFLSSWVADKDTSAVKLFEALSAAMLEVRDLLATSINSSL